MCADKTDYDKLVKDHLRMRLMESGWTDQLSRMVNDSITKRMNSGQTTKNIKFDELYTDVIDKARDAITNEMEVEFHEKIGEYLSLNASGEASGSSVSAAGPSNEASCSTADDPSDVPSDVSSDDDETQKIPSKPKRPCYQ